MNLNEKLDELDKQFLEEYKFNDSEAKYLKQYITFLFLVVFQKIYLGIIFLDDAVTPYYKTTEAFQVFLNR